ncbi:MAG: glycosyltransferase family 4 protein [Kiritimatiellae bacterium]|nr:glycosyltransferase family 4 protein [Kiritimatiellia bacterium]MDW8459536.1 glycosyltransferase family 4 protein [Verrucomicrobiota bacterium]
MRDARIYGVYFRPHDFMHRSGLEPLVEAVGAVPIVHGCYWKKWGRWHWRLESALRKWGQRYYGSEWNYLLPFWDEHRIARQIREPGSVVHFLFAEFAGPRRSDCFHRRGVRVAGTFHASPRRQEQVCGGIRLEAYDAISVVSNGQRAWFVGKGYPPSRIFLTLHGVDAAYFKPDPARPPTPDDQPLMGLLVGSTERDHELAAAVMNALPDGVMTLYVATKPYPHPAYRGIRNVILYPHLSDEDLLRAYQKADLLVMPLLDATANNAVLEAMACGTPVVTNRTCGAADYIEPNGGWIVEDACVDAWVEILCAISRAREQLPAKRAQARAWAERFHWPNLVPQYKALYAAALAP